MVERGGLQFNNNFPGDMIFGSGVTSLAQLIASSMLMYSIVFNLAASSGVFLSNSDTL